MRKGLEIYVPRDEQFGPLKLSGFLGYGIKSIVQFYVSEFWARFDGTRDEFDSFEDVLKIYDGGLKLPDGIRESYRKILPLETLKALSPSDGEGLAKLPMPQIISKGTICKFIAHNNRI